MADHILVEGLVADTVIGLYDWERLVRQTIRIDLRLECDLRRAGASDRVVDTVDYKNLTQAVRDRIESSRYKLIETLACDVAEACLARPRVERVEVTVHKTGALRHADNVAVTIDRRRSDPSGRPPHRAYVGIGSNIDPVQHVRSALESLHEEFGALRVSPAFRTAAVGSEGASDFLNLAVELRTSRDPVSLWKWLRDLEEQCGRVRTEDRNAPRTLDLDLLLYDDLVRGDTQPRLPDPLIATTPFILVPLAAIAGPEILPGDGRTLREIREAMPIRIAGVEPYDEAVLF